MGKTRKQKPKVPQVNPIGLPSVRDAAFNEELLGAEAHPHGPIAAIVDQLQSVNIEEKMCALQTLSFLCQHEQRISEIIKSDIVKTIASWLVDPSNKNIRHATAGALRNLSLNGIDVCENLVERDVLTPLLSLLNEYASNTDWKPNFDISMQNQINEEADTFLHAISLLLNLCESTGVALKNFNQTKIVGSFIRYLDYKVFGVDISIAVAKCLLVITEDNTEAWQILKEYEVKLTSLFSLEETHACTLLSTLSAAICANIPSAAAKYLNGIFVTLSKTLNINHRIILNSISSSIPLNVKKNEIIVVEDSNAVEVETDAQASLRRRQQDLPTDIEIEVKHVGWLLEAQRLAAETINNICTNDDNDNDDSLEEADSDTEIDHDYEGSSSSYLQDTDKLPGNVLEAIKSLGIVETLWQRAQPITENVADILNECEKPLIIKVNRLRISSSLCLHNLCNTMITEDLGGSTAIYNVWIEVGQQVFRCRPDPQLLEASTSLMRASLEHLKRSPDLFKQMTCNDLQLILNGIQNCEESQTRANLLRMLGVLGCLLPEEMVRLIILFIVNACCKENDAWTISEAMDAFMDIFSNNDWEEIVFDLNLVVKTNQIEQLLKEKVREQKRELGELFSAVRTVQKNLSRFSRYMETNQRKFNRQ